MGITVDNSNETEKSVTGRIKQVVVGLRATRVDVATPEGDVTAWVPAGEGEQYLSRVDRDVKVTTGRHGAIVIGAPAAGTGN